jgi:hypothetical protein
LQLYEFGEGDALVGAKSGRVAWLALDALQCLKPQGGVALVAAKTLYFGVGGGTQAFAKVVEEDGGSLVSGSAVSA